MRDKRKYSFRVAVCVVFWIALLGIFSCCAVKIVYFGFFQRKNPMR